MLYINQGYNLFAFGKSFDRAVHELTVAEGKVKTEAFEGGGIHGAAEIPVGYEALKPKMKLVGFHPEFAAASVMEPWEAARFTFRGFQVDHTDGTEHEDVTVIESQLSSDPETWKSGSLAGVSYELTAVRYLKRTVDDVIVYEWARDLGGWLVKNGQKFGAGRRAALGLPI